MKFSTNLTLAVLLLFNLCAGIISTILLQQNFNAMLDASCGQYARMQLSLCRTAETALEALPEPCTAAERNAVWSKTVETAGAYLGLQYARVYIRQQDGTAVYKNLPEGITDAQAAKAEALVIKQTYEQNMLEAKAQASSILERAQRSATIRGEEIIRQANDEAVAIREKASADIAQEKKKAINDAKDEIAGLSLAIAGKVVGKELTEADQKSLIDSFIDELGDQV